jgi:hypothetical protein
MLDAAQGQQQVSPTHLSRRTTFIL